jgi:hypothetical protein
MSVTAHRGLHARGHTSADEIVIWLGTSLADQIALVWLPALIRALDVDPDRIKMIQFHRGER